jgi:DnaJ-class molecular chaperone
MSYDEQRISDQIDGGLHNEKLTKRGRPKNGTPRQATAKDCFYCEGTKMHWGKPCGACNGTGKEIVRKQLQKVYNSENGLPINSNLDQ